MQVAFTLNFRSTRAVASRLFSPAAIRTPPPPLAGEPYPFGWIPVRGRNVFARVPPRDLTEQLLDELEGQYGAYDDPYNPQTPRP